MTGLLVVARPAAPSGTGAWFTAAELADLALPGMPRTKRGMRDVIVRQGWAGATDDQGAPLSRPRRDRGGGVEYHLSLLPDAAKARLMERGSSPVAAEPAAPRPDRESVWMRYDRLPASMKAEAQNRLAVVQRVEDLVRAGLGKGRAAEEVVAQARREAAAAGHEAPFCLSTLYKWVNRIDGVDRADRLAYLAPNHVGRVETAPIPDDLMDLYKADYLRLSEPKHAASYRRVLRIASPEARVG